MEKKKYTAGISVLLLILVLAGICIWLLHGAGKPQTLGGTLVRAPYAVAEEKETPPDEEAVYFWFGKEQI